MNYMQVINDFNFPDQTVQKGKILAVDNDGGELVFILEGPLKYRSVHINHLKDFDILAHIEELEQSNLMLLEGEKELKRQVNSLVEEAGLKRRKYDRLDKEIGEVLNRLQIAHKERDYAVAALERAMLDHQPVVLPKEVAEAIDKIREQDTKWNSFSTFCLLDKVNVALRADGRCSRIVSVIADWVSNDLARKDNLVKALVNGYTVEVEETVEDQIKNGVLETIKNWDKLPTVPNYNPEKGHEFLAEMITDYVKEFYSKH